MKKIYLAPAIGIQTINTEQHLLAGSGNIEETDSGLSITLGGSSDGSFDNSTINSRGGDSFWDED